MWAFALMVRKQLVERVMEVSLELATLFVKMKDRVQVGGDELISVGIKKLNFKRNSIQLLIFLYICRSVCKVQKKSTCFFRIQRTACSLLGQGLCQFMWMNIF